MWALLVGGCHYNSRSSVRTVCSVQNAVLTATLHTKRRNRWKYWILAAVSFVASGHYFGCFVAWAALGANKHFQWPEVVTRCCDILHEQQQRILMRSDGREWTHALLVSTLFSWPAHLLRIWREQRPSNKSDRDSSVTWEDPLLFPLFYSRPWLLLGCTLNCTSCLGPDWF
jgi:hypothetical protein